MKVGLPRALLHYYYFPFWKGFFDQLNIETILSDKTTKQLVQNGINTTVADICLPIKLFNAHVLNLLTKNVDLILVPRFVSVLNTKWLCPKYLGLPELVRYTIEDVKSKMLIIDIETKNEDLSDLKLRESVLNTLGITKAQGKKAVEAGSKEFNRFHKKCKEGYTFNEVENLLYNDTPLPKLEENPEITIGVLGYVYNVYDPFISMDIIEKLREMNVKVVTFDMFGDTIKFKTRKQGTYWTFTSKIQSTATTLASDDGVDGIIHISAFICGLDSVLGKNLEKVCDANKKPFMTIRVDEHTGESHLQTRIEAFTDMIKSKKYHLNRG